MALVLKDRVRETTTTTSTGTYTLAGAVTGYQSFAVVGDGNTTYYTVTNGTDWEVGIGTYTASGTTLSRDTILESSNAGSAVNWGVGSKDVFLTYPAEKAVTADGVNPFTSPVLVDVNSASTALEIRQIGAGNALLVEDSANPDSSPSVIDARGNLILGKTTRQSVIDNKFEIHSTGSESLGGAPSVGLYNWSATASHSSYLSFYHYPSGVVGTTTTANASGDALGRIRWYTQNGAGTLFAATIAGTTASDLASVNLTYTANSHSFSGAITSGTWNGSAIGIAYGGTGQTTQTAAFDALSPATTKGDLIVDNGTNNVRLPVGTNGHVLTADSTATEGVKWAAAGGISSADIQEFTSVGSSTWTKPAGAKLVYVLLFGGGGGGGGGRRRSTSTIAACGGGGGGAAGGRTEFWIPASDLDATESVVVGSGGSGGAGATTDDSSGSFGADGGASNFAGIAYALAGGAGFPGTTAGGAGGTASGGSGELRTAGTNYTAAGGGGSTAAGSNGFTSGYRAGGGGGGAGNPISNTTSNSGGSGGLGGSFGAGSSAANGGGGGGGTGGTGGAGTAGANAATYFYGGSGGGGGGNGITAAAGAGGDGGFPGGGGGGGGAGTARNGGNGGAGGGGFVRVVTFF